MAPVATPASILPEVIEVEGYSVLYFGPAALVSSKSHVGDFHTVASGSCSCVGFAGEPGKFEGRGACNHVRVAAIAMERDRETATPDLGQCRWNSATTRCRAHATGIYAYSDHHGSHEQAYCDKHMPKPSLMTRIARPTVSPENEAEFTKAMMYDPERQARTGYALNN